MTRPESEIRDDRRPRILLVEDNDAASKGLVKFLSIQGFDVMAVHDGASAIQALRDGPRFDFLLTDLCLPDLDGRQLARIARERADPPAIALITGWDVDTAGGDNAKWGIDWVFLKPVDLGKLVRTLRGRAESPPGPGRGDSGPVTP